MGYLRRTCVVWMLAGLGAIAVASCNTLVGWDEYVYAGSDSGAPGSASSSGGGSAASTASGAGGEGGAGGAPMDGGTSDLPGLCNNLCGYLGSIGCQAWPGCSTECVGGFNAPAQCQDEFEAMITCWEANSMSFVCTMNQLVPPPECQALEEAFNECFSGAGPNDDGGAGCMPQPGVCNKTDTSCSCKSNCAGTDLKWACLLPAGSVTWSCSCYETENDVDTLLGTCSQTEMGCLNNTMGCCDVFFVGQ